ncbi:MAG: hypothetical protein [Caudoviricetes sp.]|nr:MAG: hypothetical protein [Caudoviricetes sp.]
MVDRNDFLTDIDNIFAKDMQDVIFANHVYEKMKSLEKSAVAGKE